MVPFWFAKTVYENHTDDDYYCATDDFWSEKCLVRSRKDDIFNLHFFWRKEFMLSKIN
jgi:hypothetical protein